MVGFIVLPMDAPLPCTFRVARARVSRVLVQSVAL